MAFPLAMKQATDKVEADPRQRAPWQALNGVHCVDQLIIRDRASAGRKHTAASRDSTSGATQCRELLARPPLSISALKPGSLHPGATSMDQWSVALAFNASGAFCSAEG